VLGGQMENDHEREIRVGRRGLKEGLEGFDAAGGSANADDGRAEVGSVGRAGAVARGLNTGGRSDGTELELPSCSMSHRSADGHQSRPQSQAGRDIRHHQCKLQDAGAP